MKVKLTKYGMYLRLSRDDDSKTESESIKNQKIFLNEYIAKHSNWFLVDIYTDDGYTGTNFNRPDFIRLINDVNAGKIDLVITKDLSRLGRDYIQVGYYTENYFPARNIRYIAVNDGVDTFSKTGHNDIGPFLAVVNDMYAKDISKKVRTVKRTKAQKGEFIGAFAPYGYKKHPNDITKLIVDEEAAEVVKYIFNEYINGKGLAYIAHRLNERKIDCPSVYKQRNSRYHCKAIANLWGHNTIKSILTNKVYTGDLIQHKGEMVSYKVKKYRLLPKSEYLIKENAHEAIIDKKTFELAQDILKRKAHNIHRKENTEHLLAGLLYCPICHNKYTYQKQSGLKDDMVAICSMYNRYGKDYCTRRAIRESVLNKFVVEDLRKNLTEKIDKEKLINSIDKNSINIEKKNIEKRITDNKKRINEINKILKTAYEDRVNGIIDTNEFITYSESYKKEQEELIQKTENLNLKLQDYENTKEKELIKYIKEIVSFENIDRNIILNLIDSIEIMDKNNIKINYKFTV